MTPVALPPALVVPRDVLRDVDAAARLEWFESDGRGGGAAGTALGAATRREHGLLIVADGWPLLLLARFEERVVLPDGDAFEPVVNFYPDAIHPQGHRFLRSFALDPWPSWHYEREAVTLVREVLVAREARATIVRWRLDGADGTLELRPLLAARNVHESGPLPPFLPVRLDERALRCAPEGGPAVVLSFAEGNWESAPDVYRNTLHPRDGTAEDLHAPGVLRLPLEDGQWTMVACARTPIEPAALHEFIAAELRRREEVARRCTVHFADATISDLPPRLALALDAWLVKRPTGRALWCGFPSLQERTADALAAIPALLEATGRAREGASVLRGFVRRTLGRGATTGNTEALLRCVPAAAALARAGIGSGELWPAVRRALEMCASRAGPSGLRDDEGAGLNELWHEALLAARVLAPDHPLAQRFAHDAERLREVAPRTSGASFPVVAEPGRPALHDDAHVADAIRVDPRSLPAARLDDYARALVRVHGAGAAPRLRELFEIAGEALRCAMLGQVPERLDGSGAPADARAAAALLSACALAARTRRRGAA